MLTLTVKKDEWIVLRDMKTKKEYARLRKGEHCKSILFEAPKSTEIRRYPVSPFLFQMRN